ncbi:hypothetical protein BWI93_18835 [Siphonobacter sp. BAB-5385]|uniref:capsule assembly Wzi family protein n=1 Tax=Siphonobacter sp. BAB-5385 TaxID=1864822 RepID=UPI000B9E15EF|nr:capsule assembly Wzi family protein [Siphonobacter sp. BAB-5385]OZI06706.1 hypothetical protein BWI93_18835 [Siphonobacter sp. BAB-5385]
MFRTSLLLVLLPTSLFAQGIFKDNETYTARLQLLAGGNLPFWMQARQYGTIPAQGPVTQASFSIAADYQRPSKTRPYLRRKSWDWGYGVNVTTNAGATNQILLPELYLKSRWGALEVYIGKRKETFGLADSTLGVGPYSWSGNAMPVPKIQIGFPNWTSLLNDRLAFQAVWAHGWLDDRTAFVRRSYLHQKTFYLRLGKPTARLQTFLGINHQVQWGGYAPSLRTSPSPTQTEYFQPNGSLPKDAAAFWSVVTAGRGKNAAYNPYDFRERVGNHVGSVDAALQLQTNGHRFLFYRQQPYEMPSLLHLANWRDGLTGVSITTDGTDTPVIRKLVVEVLYTKNQGRKGSPFGQGPVWEENYFNHRQYQQGWSYRERTLGTPLLAPTRAAEGLFTKDNLLSAVHLGLDGSLGQGYTFNGRFTYLHSDGTPESPYTRAKQQVSLLLELRKPVWFLKGSELLASGAADFGDVYPQSWGFSMGIRKSWGFADEDIPEIARYRLKYRSRRW